MNTTKESSESIFSVATIAPNNDRNGYNVVPAQAVILLKKVIFLGIFPVLIIVGLILNTLCCVMFCKLKSKSSTVIMLFALAVSDILILINATINSISMASNYYEVPFTRQERIQLVPYFDSYISTLPSRIGNLLTLLISIERLFCVLKPMKIRQYSTKKTACIAVLFCYVFTILMCLPLLFLYRSDEIYSNSTGTVIHIVTKTEFGKNTVFFEVLYFVLRLCFVFIPVVGVMITSIITGCVVIVSARRRSKIAEGSSERKVNKELQVTKTLLIITFTFVLCQLPSSILMLIIFIGMTPYRYTSNVYEVAMPVTYAILLINSVINFIIYYSTSGTYKNEIKTMFGCTVKEGTLNRPCSTKVTAISGSNVDR